MKVLVLGAGAIGGYFGGRLAEAGADITFLVRPARREQLAREGLRVESPLGNLHLCIRTVTAPELRAGYDLVLLTAKAYDLESALDAIAPAMDGTCAVLPLLNGLKHFVRLDERFGADNVMGGTCTIGATLRSDGVIQHDGELQRLIFGEREGARSARAQGFADLLAMSKIDWHLSADIEQDLWEKIVFLSTLAAATCLFRANVSEIIAAPGGREAIEGALDAAIEIASREGHPPRVMAIEFARRGLTDPGGKWSASMLRDLEAGGRVESDPIVGWMLEKARQHGIESPLLSLAYTHLKAYEARRAAGRLPS